MNAVELIADDEIILRRIPPSTPQMNSTKERPQPEWGHRAVSCRLSTAPGEEGLSCTRLRQTSPKSLLADLLTDDIVPTDWLVCRIIVRDVRSLGLEVIHKPTDRDPGHCEIVGKDKAKMLAFPNKKSQQLAKKTRILTTEEVAELKAGDTFVD